MSGGKETSRQKMIGMMYLVLTALLAMNVSKEVVNAFVTIDQGQRKTLAAIDGKLSTQLQALATNAGENGELYGAANISAKTVHSKATELIRHIDLIKAKTFAISIGAPLEGDIPAEVYANGKFLIGLDSVKALVGIDNYDNNTNLMVKEPANPTIEDNPDGNNYTGTVLRDKLIEYREQIIGELKKIKRTETLVLNMEQTFDFPTAEEAKGTGEEQWVVKNFYHVPLAASTAMLTTLQSQIRSAESDLVDKLYTDVEGESLKFNALRGASIPLSTTVTQGGDFEADVFMAAFDDANPPEVRLGNIGVKFDSTTMDLDGEYEIIPMEGVTGKLKIPAGGLGAQTRDGVIYFKPVGGELRKEPFYLDYLVLAPQLIVSPTKMNVFYKGLPNPVNISVPGFTSDKVFPVASAGSLSKGSEGYVMNIGKGNTVNISASVELPDGSKKQMAPVPFRVKRVPDPVPSFSQAKPTDNVISGLKVKNAKGLRADMGDDFEFDYTPIVTSFKVVTVVNGEIKEAKCTGNTLNETSKGILSTMRRGQKFSIEEIMVKMPEGNRKVSSISLRII